MAQLPIKNRTILQFLIGFAAFFVLTSPATAGAQTRAFFGFIGDSLDSFRVYLDGVFDDGATTPGTTGSTTVTVVVPVPAAPATTTA